ncbi:MAG TPA: phosphate ABC transporter ATP-binding protein PstB [Anaerolineales bacterium]|nr:phosphate ABC transporter ATP-binding protein PstB [Anaerolineales bacterium]
MDERLVGLRDRGVSLAARQANVIALEEREPKTGVEPAPEELALESRGLRVYYGEFLAIRDVNLSIQRRKITAIIGPSGCGKTTLLRSFNRMNELVPTARTEGEVIFQGQNIYADKVDSVEVRRRIGMVFQKPNPFPKSIYENIAWGARINGFQGSLDGLVEESLKRAALWDEVSDKLDQSGLSLSGGQQQRLCIARAIAVRPDVILMDEPCSSLDPVATFRIEELMRQLASDYTIVIVTHNMQQAARVSDFTAMMMLGQERAGEMIEFDQTGSIFTRPKDKRTEDYVTGRFG